MVIRVYSQMSPASVKPYVFTGEHEFIPDQALTIQEIMIRAHRGMLRDVTMYNEMPEDMPEFVDDLTELLEPRADDVSDLE